MTRISLDLDPRVVTRLRALANRRGVTVDAIAGELLGAAVRSPAARTEPATPRLRAGSFGPIDVEYPDDDPTDGVNNDVTDDLHDRQSEADPSTGNPPRHVESA